MGQTNTPVLSANNVVPGTNVTLSWSGAGAGTNNPIAGYEVYLNGAYYNAVSTAATSGSMTVPSGGTHGNVYTYTVRTKATYGSTGYFFCFFCWRRSLFHENCTCAPTAVSMSTANPVLPNTAVTLSWSGAAAGWNNAITGYLIYSSTTVSGSYTHIYSQLPLQRVGSATVYSPAGNTTYTYFKVVTRGSLDSSALSASSAFIRTLIGSVVAPTTLTLNTTNPVIHSAQSTLSWSGAGAGTNNPHYRI